MPIPRHDMFGTCLVLSNSFGCLPHGILIGHTPAYCNSTSSLMGGSMPFPGCPSPAHYLGQSLIATSLIAPLASPFLSRHTMAVVSDVCFSRCGYFGLVNYHAVRNERRTKLASNRAWAHRLIWIIPPCWFWWTQYHGLLVPSTACDKIDPNWSTL